MKKYKVAILGATGAVGREMMKILAERSFPVEELHLLASERSAGQKIQWQGRELTVEPACDEAFRDLDIVLGAAENDIAKRFAPAIVKAGAEGQLYLRAGAGGAQPQCVHCGADPGEDPRGAGQGADCRRTRLPAGGRPEE